MKSNIVKGVDNQIAETNKYLMQFGEEISDPRAIEMVKETGQYAKNRGANVSDYVHSAYDTNQLTKLFAKGVSKEELTKFYENTIKSNIDLDAKDYNSFGIGELNNYNINLKKFFELPTEEKVSYLNKLKNFGKKAIPVALAASLVGAPVVSASDNVEEIPEDWYDETAKDAGFNIQSIMEFEGGFDEINKPTNELIKKPDDTLEIIKNKMYKDATGRNKFYTIDVATADIHTWLAVDSEGKYSPISSYLALVDTDGNEKPDTLFAMYLSQREDGELTSAVAVPRGGFHDENGNQIKFDEGYPDCLINPFDTLGSDDSNIANLLYFKDPSMINFGDKPTAIHWKDAVGKTPKEIFGGSSNTLVSEPKVHETEIYKNPVEDKSISEEMKTDPATEKTPGFVGTLGFGAMGMAAYLVRKYKNKGDLK